MGAPTPVNTVVLSRSSRAPITASSSFAVTLTTGPGGAWSRRQHPAALDRAAQALLAEQGQVVGVAARRVDVALKVVGDAGGPTLLDRVDVGGEVVRPRVVGPVALVRVGAVRHVRERVDGEAG